MGNHEAQARTSDSVRFGTETDPKALIRRAEALLDALSILARSKSDNASRLGLNAVRECRSSLELLMKAHGMLAGDAQVNVTIDARRQQVAFPNKLPETMLRALAKGDCPCCGNTLVEVTVNKGLSAAIDTTVRDSEGRWHHQCAVVTSFSRSAIAPGPLLENILAEMRFSPKAELF